MKYQEYQVTTTFTYSNGMPGGIITKRVKGMKKAQAQLSGNREWLRIKGHKINEETIKPIS